MGILWEEETPIVGSDSQKMWIFNLGMPRSARKWAYNVAREQLTQTKGLSYKGFQTSPQELDRLLETVPLDSHCGLIEASFLTKSVHQQLAGRRAKAICTYRDPRDVVVSLMKFTGQQDFESVLEAVTKQTVHIDRCAKLPDCLLLNYDSIQEQPEETAIQIANFLEISIDAEIIRAIAKRYNRFNMQKLIDSLPLLPTTDVQRIYGRLTHTETLYMQNHFSSELSGQWRNAWTVNEVAHCRNHLSEWLIRYGFENHDYWTALSTIKENQAKENNRYPDFLKRPGITARIY